MRRSASLIFVLTVLAIGCGGDIQPEQPQAPDIGDQTQSAVMEFPFTADEIRDEWVTGLILNVRRSHPEGTSFERWTVVNADERGADIEYVTTDGSGNAIGEPRIEHTTWVELRDHASFPATHSTREWVSRSTQIGDLEGWLYRVSDPETGTVQEFFFAAKVPGAPVQMRILDGEDTVYELEQLMRMRPVTE
jgi:hypothetical protein